MSRRDCRLIQKVIRLLGVATIHRFLGMRLGVSRGRLSVTNARSYELCIESASRCLRLCADTAVRPECVHIVSP